MLKKCFCVVFFWAVLKLCPIKLGHFFALLDMGDGKTTLPKTNKKQTNKAMNMERFLIISIGANVEMKVSHAT